MPQETLNGSTEPDRLSAAVGSLAGHGSTALLSSGRGSGPANRGDRDIAIIGWIARHGAVTLGQLRVRFAIGRTAAYRRIAALIEIRLLERVKPLYGAPALLRATAAGVRLAGHGYPVCCVSAGSVPHWIACADVALALEQENRGSGAKVLSEREIRWAERQAQGPIASARIHQGAEGHRGLHRPDLAVVEPGRIVAVEVELTAKGRARLETIIRAWRRARWIDSVRYYVPAGPVMSGLEAAVARLRAGERVELHQLESEPW